MNTENSKTNEPHRFRFILAYKLMPSMLIKTWHWLSKYLLYMENH